MTIECEMRDGSVCANGIPPLMVTGPLVDSGAKIPAIALYLLFTPLIGS